MQHGLEPDDWKPMQTIGVGVREIRVRNKTGTFRVIYHTKKEGIFVLHAFQKKAHRTSKKDLDVAKARYRELI